MYVYSAKQKKLAHFLLSKNYIYAMKRIAIIDDDPIILEITKQHLSRVDDSVDINVFQDVTSFIENQLPVDLIFLDIHMTPISGVQGIPLIQTIYQDTPIIILSSNEVDEIILQTIKLGAVGYILKSDINSINEAVLDAIYRGDSIVTPSITKKLINSITGKSSILDKLTRREREVADLILRGLSYKMVAYELGISIDTVRMNVKNIYRKLNINSKAELFHSTNHRLNNH
jgi:DNA-binding NarL/FixJ family response regulator